MNNRLKVLFKMAIALSLSFGSIWASDNHPYDGAGRVSLASQQSKCKSLTLLRRI